MKMCKNSASSEVFTNTLTYYNQKVLTVENNHRRSKKEINIIINGGRKNVSHRS
jgi:hypothetical protein